MYLVLQRHDARTASHLQDATRLPCMDEHGKLPPNFARTHGELIMWADGFAQVCVASTCKLHGMTFLMPWYFSTACNNNLCMYMRCQHLES